MKWTFETAAPDGDCRLFGVNIFSVLWRNCGEAAVVIDPHYGVEKRFPVHEVTIRGEVHRFAAGEFSNGIFGFYLPKG